MKIADVNFDLCCFVEIPAFLLKKLPVIIEVSTNTHCLWATPDTGLKSIWEYGCCVLKFDSILTENITNWKGLCTVGKTVQKIIGTHLLSITDIHSEMIMSVNSTFIKFIFCIGSNRLSFGHSIRSLLII